MKFWDDSSHPTPDTLPAERKESPSSPRELIISDTSHVSSAHQAADGRGKEGRKAVSALFFLLFSRIKCPSHSGFGSLEEGKKT